MTSIIEHDEIQILTFSAVLPNTVGRDLSRLKMKVLAAASFRSLLSRRMFALSFKFQKSIIEAADETDDKNKLEFRNQALDFINEMGLLLYKSSLKFRHRETNGAMDLFPFKRFKWLIEFSTEQEWCDVVKKLLGVLFDGNVDSGQFCSVTLALLNAGLLHKAVRRNCSNANELGWWELTVLASHVHPSVAAMASTLLSGVNIVYDGNPLTDLTFGAFLDKFMEKKPRQTTWCGSSEIEPAKKLDMNHQLLGAEILSLAEADVLPEDVVFHKFYMNKMNSSSSKKSKKKKNKKADEEWLPRSYMAMMLVVKTMLIKVKMKRLKTCWIP